MEKTGKAICENTKKGGYMQRLPQFTRGHIILFGSAKFIAGLVIGFGLGVYFLPFLTAKKVCLKPS